MPCKAGDVQKLVCISFLRRLFYTVSKNRLMWHTFISQQRLLITFGREREMLFNSQLTMVESFYCTLAYNQLRGFHNNSSDLTHPNNQFLGWLPTTYYQQGNKRVAKRLWACVEDETLALQTLVAIFYTAHCLHRNICLFKRFNFSVHKAACGKTCT